MSSMRFPYSAMVLLAIMCLAAGVSHGEINYPFAYEGPIKNNFGQLNAGYDATVGWFLYMHDGTDICADEGTDVRAPGCFNYVVDYGGDGTDEFVLLLDGDSGDYVYLNYGHISARPRFNWWDYCVETPDPDTTIVGDVAHGSYGDGFGDHVHLMRQSDSGFDGYDSGWWMGLDHTVDVQQLLDELADTTRPVIVQDPFPTPSVIAGEIYFEFQAYDTASNATGSSNNLECRSYELFVTYPPGSGEESVALIDRSGMLANAEQYACDDFYYNAADPGSWADYVQGQSFSPDSDRCHHTFTWYEPSVESAEDFDFRIVVRDASGNEREYADNEGGGAAVIVESFVCVDQGGVPKLEWRTTEHESQLTGFRVWRSVDGTDYEEISGPIAIDNPGGGDGSYYEYVDASAPLGLIFYKLEGLRADNESGFVGSIEYCREEHPLTVVSLRTPHPNPTRGGSTLVFGAPEGSSVELSVYDIAGRPVRTLYSGSASGGEQSVRWDRRDSEGMLVSAGVYLCQLRAGGVTRRAKIVVLD